MVFPAFTMLLVSFMVLCLCLPLSSAYFTEKEHDALKKLPRNPLMESKGDFDKFEESLDEFEEELDGVLLKLIECRKLPGVSISIVKPGIGVWTKGLGTTHIYGARKRKISGNTNFQIHALTRSFTTVLLIIALSEHNTNNPDNMYTFDTKMIDIMGPEYNLSNSYITNEVTLKDLMASRVGFRLRLEVTEADSEAPFGRQAVNSREYKCKALNFMDDMAPFRDGYHYNHYDWMLLGHIAEKLTGRSWEWLIINKILKPAGMTRTKIWNDMYDVERRDTVHPVVVYPETNMRMYHTTSSLNAGRSPFEPSIGVMANGDDMAKWMYILLTNGRAPNGNQIFDTSLYFDTFEPSNYFPREFPMMHRPLYPVGIEMNGISLPWIHGNYRGFRHHSLISMADFGTSAAMFLLRDINVGVFIATQGPGKSIHDLSELVLYPLSYFLLDKVIGLKPFYSQSNICTYPFYRDARDDFNMDKKKESVDKMKVGNPDVVSYNDISNYNLNEGNNDTVSGVPPSVVNSVVGTYLHSLYGYIFIIVRAKSVFWLRSFSNLGNVFFNIGLNDTIPLETDCRWFRPNEYGFTYSIGGCNFLNLNSGKYQMLQIPDGGPIYERVLRPRSRAMKTELNRAAEFISKIKPLNIWKRNLLPLE